MKQGRLNIVMDLQWGSTGKGKLAFYLGMKFDANVAICDFQTNAGHTVVLDDDRKFVLQQLPVMAIKDDCRLLINPGATLWVDKVLEEIETHKAQKRLTIHPYAAVVTEKAREWERENLKRISSTLKGVGATLGLKTMRHPDVILAKDEPRLAEWIGDTTALTHQYLRAGAMVIGESAQGFDLSLNHGHRYPYVTSRDVTPASFLSNAGVPVCSVGDIYGCIRTYPIRVGHQLEKMADVPTDMQHLVPDSEKKFVKVGDSGPIYEDQMELNWEALQRMSGATHSLEERTTVTQKVRRVFTFSQRQYRRALEVCMPNKVFVNFINHVDARDGGAHTWGELSMKSKQFIDMVNDIGREVASHSPQLYPSQITHVGTGAKNGEIITLE